MLGLEALKDCNTPSGTALHSADPRAPRWFYTNMPDRTMLNKVNKVHDAKTNIR